MSNSKMIDAWMAAFENKDMDAFATLLADDFVLHATNLPNPLNGDQLKGFLNMLHNAFSDVDFHWNVVNATDDKVEMTYQLTGTHDGVLAAAGLGMKDFEATNKSLSLPTDEYHLTVENGKVTRIDVDPPEGAGLGGVIQQLELA